MEKKECEICSQTGPLSYTILLVFFHHKRWTAFRRWPLVMVKVIVVNSVESWRVTITAGKDSPRKYSHIHMCQWVCVHPLWCFWGSRCAGICPTGSAQLLSPHYPLRTRTDVISFSVSRSTFTPPVLHRLSLMSLLSFCLPESTLIPVLSLFSPNKSGPSLDWLSLWWCWVTLRVTLGFVGQGCSQQQGVRGRSGRDGGHRVGSKASSSGHPLNLGAWFLLCHPWRSTSHCLMCPCHIFGGLLLPELVMLKAVWVRERGTERGTKE